jgi:hypothetical protein
LFSKIMIAKRRQERGQQLQPILSQSTQRREAIQDRDGDQKDQQRSEQADQIPAQRNPPPQAAPGEVPHPSPAAHQGGNDKRRHRRPEHVLKHPMRCRSARQQPRLGQTLGTKTSAAVVAYTNTKNVAMACRLIHNLSVEASAARTSADRSAMIGYFLSTAVMRQHHPHRTWTIVRPARLVGLVASAYEGATPHEILAARPSALAGLAQQHNQLISPRIRLADFQRPWCMMASSGVPWA